MDAAQPQVANLDDDLEPEVLYTVESGVMLFEHDGTYAWGPDPLFQTTGTDMNRPLNIHNYDSDPAAEFSAAGPYHYGIFNVNRTSVWTAEVFDQSGQAGGTAFDFIGTGIAQATYMDEYTVYVFPPGGGAPLMELPYQSATLIEYPTVADIDNDGSAEILIGWDPAQFGAQAPFTVRAIRDAEDRWIQARRIFNQHTYHVTYVREDGTVPQHEAPHWWYLNTFRTQTQIEEGGVCMPPPQG